MQQCNVPAGNDFVAVTAGVAHGLALKRDGSIVGWGWHPPVPAGNDFVAVSAGFGHSLALKSDGSIVNVGAPYSAPTGNDFVAISAGVFHSLALRSDGSVEAFGSNRYGECNVPPGNFVAIAGGDECSFAIKSDGSLAAWGRSGWFGEPWDVPEGNNFVAIAAGDVHYGVALAAEPAIEAEIDINPDTLNLKSKGKWISCHIWLPEEHDVADVNAYSVFLEDEIGAEWIWADEQEQVLMAKFSRAALQEMLAELETPTQVELLVTGELVDGTRFEGTDVIKVIDKGKKK